MEYHKVREVETAMRKGQDHLVESAEMARLAAEACEDKKAKEVRVLDIRSISMVSDYFVICSGSSTTQVRAIADNVEKKMEGQFVQRHHVEGYPNGRWILLDYGDVVVHVMHEDEREFYNLERLWGDAPQLELKRNAG